MQRITEKFSPLTEKMRDSCFIQTYLVVITLICIAVISAGCVTQAEPIETQTVDVPQDLDEAMGDFISDLKNIDLALTIDIYTLANKISSLDTYDDIEAAGREYYSRNSWIERIIYYDAVKGKFINIPSQYAGSIIDYVIPPSESDFSESGGIIRRNGVYIEGDGYMEVWYAAVHDKAGKYAGYLAFVYDWHTALKGHEIAGENVSYGDCIVYLCSNDNLIMYSSKSEYTGQTFSVDNPLRTKESILFPEEGKYGAYTYACQAFYIYNDDVTTQKVTSWQKFVYHGNDYTVYLTKEVDAPEVIYTDIFTPDIVTMKEEVIDAYVEGSHNGVGAVERRIEGGDYATRIYAADMDGTVLAAPGSDEALKGSSLLNTRDAYDSPYIKKAVYVARQGGGYIKCLLPVDGTVNPKAGLFNIAYVAPVENEWYLMGLTPGNTKLTPINQKLKSDVVLVSRALVQTACDRGIGTLTEIVTTTPDISGSMFVHGADYEKDTIVILDYDGYSYANTQDPSYNGQSLTFYTDALMTSLTRTAIMLAKSGGGVMYDFRGQTNEKEYCDLWLYSVEPVNEDYFVVYGTIVMTVKNTTIPAP